MRQSEGALRILQTRHQMWLPDGVAESRRILNSRIRINGSALNAMPRRTLHIFATAFGASMYVNTHTTNEMTDCSASAPHTRLIRILSLLQVRRNWLPQRPKGKGKVRPSPRVHRQRARALYTYSPPGSIPRSSPDDERPNSSTGIPSASNGSTTTSSSLGMTETDTAAPIPEPSREFSLKLQSALDAPPVSVAVAGGIRDDPLCIICMAREKTSAFVHGKIAHMCCCFPCGDKTVKRAGKCPVCRRKIQKVVKVIII